VNSFLISYETSEGLTRCLEFEAPTVEAALIKWERIRRPGDFIESIGHPCRIQWPD
jgi:hypothetical protein